jgi:phosphoribosylformylglycinamidine synthase I
VSPGTSSGASLELAVLRFPGTNCDRDCFEAVEAALCKAGVQTKVIWWWHEDQPDPTRTIGAILPGGFSHGDYLRCGALASRSPVMKSLKVLADRGEPVLGICNGFQILCESGLLPGVLLRNEGLRFVDRWVDLELVPQIHSTEKLSNSIWRNSWKENEFTLPVAHGEGRYFVPPETLSKMKASGQIWLKYRNNPNGALEDIAGILNEAGNVAALMPHPERAMHSWMGSTSGTSFFDPFIQRAQRLEISARGVQ